MDERERIEELLHHFRMDQREFARVCGFDHTIVSNIKSGKTGISKRVFDKIITAFPSINKSWLSEGEGKMLKNGQNITDSPNSTLVGGDIKGKGHIIQHIVSSDKMEELLLGNQAIIKEQQAIVKEQQQQINKLVDAIMKLSEKF